MSDAANISLCVLWESELRTAARLLQKAFTKPEAVLEDAAAEEASRALMYHDALLAAYTALAHLTDDRAVVIISPPMPAKDLP